MCEYVCIYIYHHHSYKTWHSHDQSSSSSLHVQLLWLLKNSLSFTVVYITCTSYKTYGSSLVNGPCHPWHTTLIQWRIFPQLLGESFPMKDRPGNDKTRQCCPSYFMIHSNSIMADIWHQNLLQFRIDWEGGRIIGIMITLVLGNHNRETVWIT